MKKQLHLGYKYTKTIDDENTAQIYFENGVIFINGFVSGKHFYNTYEMNEYKTAKNFFKNCLV